MEEVRAQVDFPVLTPRNYPESVEVDIYAPQWVAKTDTVWISESVLDYPKDVAVAGIYKRWHVVLIHQLKIQDEQRREFPVSDARALEVEVRDRTRYWIQDPPTGFLKSYGSIGSILSNDTEPVWVL